MHCNFIHYSKKTLLNSNNKNNKFFVWPNPVQFHNQWPILYNTLQKLYINKYYNIWSSTSQIPHPNDLLVPNNIYMAI